MNSLLMHEHRDLPCLLKYVLVHRTRRTNTDDLMNYFTQPVVNPMLGPSSSALINLGARFPPCMKLVYGIPPSTLLPCLDNLNNPPDKLCTVEDVCGFGGFKNKDPDQWYR